MIWHCVLNPSHRNQNYKTVCMLTINKDGIHRQSCVLVHWFRKEIFGLGSQHYRKRFIIQKHSIIESRNINSISVFYMQAVFRFLLKEPGKAEYLYQTPFFTSIFAVQSRLWRAAFPFFAHSIVTLHSSSFPLAGVGEVISIASHTQN